MARPMESGGETAAYQHRRTAADPLTAGVGPVLAGPWDNRTDAEYDRS
jgi:hypothetical protein